MDGYAIEIEPNGSVTAFGNGWFKELGSVTSLGLGNWGATDLHGRQVLHMPVNERDLAIQVLVRAAGLGTQYVVRDSESAEGDEGKE